ncbi:hypothetical protein BLNAU_18881 [Blattamonas nauphoetae]|uniref:Serpin domain-containing protein n=1 Tax=Blattamonas nauphoetae TaxID=2049346 RepID=A0ABQ9X363_9EUKA|nr:hypothetical protein BLNAU_18881 [Blattamonas nauphoetae]
MAAAFSNNAQFPRISPEPLAIDQVIHKSVLKVNEEGVEAAAATISRVKMRKRAGRITENPIVFNVNRPFVVPEKVRTIRQASPLFLSLVAFVREGNNLDHKATRKACALLDKITPEDYREQAIKATFTKLVPTPDRSSSGLANSLALLLASSNEKLVESTLIFLRQILSVTPEPVLFNFIQSGFFTLLPQTFYEQELHLLPNRELHLMNIVTHVMHSKYDTFRRRPSAAPSLASFYVPSNRF